jgi:hypothetical protein
VPFLWEDHLSDAVKAMEPVPLWRARAWLIDRSRRDGAYGFGGPDVAEAVGTAVEVGAELTGFLNSLDWQEVEAARLEWGTFAVRLEIEPASAGASKPAGKVPEGPHEDSVPLWEARASAGNANGVFDAAYAFGNSKGDEGHLLGSAEELGAELGRVLAGLTCGDVERMRYGTDRFFVEVTVELPRRE